MTDSAERTRFDPRYHGRTIRLSGLVRALPSPVTLDQRLLLESDGFVLGVDVSSCPKVLDALQVGTRIEASGVCVMETENRLVGANFPRVHGFLLAVRSAADIRILSQPSWWTPFRVLCILGIMLILIILILIWNLALRRLAERRGKQLALEQVARKTSDLKVRERTRLAVELHDALAQNLTGASMQIRTAGRIFAVDPTAMRHHLDIAVRTLDSCREELRNCIWDLRSNALESDEMDDAIRRTLKMHADGAKVSVRFNVPRNRLSDNVMHTLLRIIRELVSNAFRHGNASAVKIAGSIEGDILRFSVRDNGIGFNPEQSPGMTEGHFGLQGIRERVARFNGEVTVSSAPGKGAKVTLSLKLSEIDREKEDQ